MKYLNFLAACIAALFLSIVSFAQNGVIEGTFRDINGAIVPKVKIDIRKHDSRDLIRSYASDELGEFRIELLAGKYSFYASAHGFEDVIFSEVDLQPNSTIALKLDLKADPRLVIACPGFDPSAIIISSAENKLLDGLSINDRKKLENPVKIDAGKSKKVRKNKQ